MKYLIEFKGGPSPMMNATTDQLAYAKDKLQTALSDGSIDFAFTKVGGGAVMVVNSSSHEALTRILRSYNVTDAQVTPLVPTVDVIEGYHQAKASGYVPPVVKEALQKSGIKA
jgi:hypothetical protein